MKKLVIILLVLIVSISLVSAGLLGDIWGKITGAQVSETNTAETCPELPTSMWCPDETTLCPTTTDEQGCPVWDCDSCTETLPEPKPDVCATKIEISFDKFTYNVGEVFNVEVGVFDAQGNPLSNYIFYAKMYDDRWHSPNSQGTGSEGYFRTSGDIQSLPSGVTSMIFEVYTEGVGDCGAVRDTTEIEVISKEEPEPIPPEPEPRPEVCAGRISISFDKNVYYVGEEFKVVMEVFDSQGNHLPNYPFFIAMYRDGMWYTFTDGRTDESGYSIHKDKMNLDDTLQLGENKFKIYTDVEGCNSVEDFVTIEIKGGEQREEVCGIGTCVPDEGEVEEIPEGEVLYSCSGCKLEGKCYPMGYRKQGKYCSDNYEFVNQIKEGMCDNNFECKSNVCVSGGCVGEGLIQKIIAWFRKLFGGGEEDEEEEAEKRCSKLLIEKNIGDYEYRESAYGIKEAQAPLFSKDGERVGVVKCCIALYDKEEEGAGALVCPFDDRHDIENTLKWSVARGEFVLEEYKGEKVYHGTGQELIVWTKDNYVMAIGTGPKTDSLFPADVADAYFKKYKNDLEDIEIPPEPPSKHHDPAKEFLEGVEGLGELTLIDFETTAAGITLQNGDKIDGNEWMSLGVVFEAPSEDYLQLFGPMHPFNPLDKLSLSPGLGPFEAGGDTHDDLNIIFSEPVKAAGIYLLDLGDTDERESITFLDEHNNVIKKISPWPKSTFGNPAPGTFVGLIYEEGISKIEILENTQDGDDIAYDNLYFVR